MPRVFLDIGYVLCEQDLLSYFSSYGPVRAVYLPRYENGRNVGYAFATIDPPKPGVRISRLDDGEVHHIKDCRVTVKQVMYNGKQSGPSKRVWRKNALYEPSSNARCSVTKSRDSVTTQSRRPPRNLAGQVRLQIVSSQVLVELITRTW